jgi:hypothetical protein
MTFAFLIYLISVLSSLKFLLITSALILFVCLVIYFIVILVEDKENAYGNKFIFTTVLLATLAAVTPSEKTAYMMIGGYVAQQMVQSETSEKVVKIINMKLDQFIAEETPAAPVSTKKD